MSISFKSCAYSAFYLHSRLDKGTLLSRWTQSIRDMQVSGLVKDNRDPVTWKEWVFTRQKQAWRLWSDEGMVHEYDAHVACSRSFRAALRCKKTRLSPNVRWVATSIRTRHMIPLLHGGSAINKRDATRQLQLFFIPGEQKCCNRILVICLTKWKIYSITWS